MSAKEFRNVDLEGLLRQARGGSGPARERLFGLMRDEVRRQAGVLVGVRRRRGLEPSDLAQEAMQRLFKGMTEFRGSRGIELRGYVRRIVENCFSQFLRSAGRQKRDAGKTVSLDELGSGPPADAPRVSEMVSRKQDRQRLMAAILMLPADQRQALWLYYEGRRVAEIATVLGRTEKAVASLLERNVRSLRAGLQQADEQATGDPLAGVLLRYLHALERGHVPDREMMAQAQADHELRPLLEGLDWLQEQLRQEELGA